MVIKMSESEYRQHVESLPDEGDQAWMNYIGNGGSMDASDCFDAGWEAANTRIRQLEKQCARLAAEIDRMQPVVTWAVTWNNIDHRDDEAEEAALVALSDACDDYEASKPK